jgi:hypothetical protein
VASGKSVLSGKSSITRWNALPLIRTELKNSGVICQTEFRVQESAVMRFRIPPSNISQLLRYPIASGDMYYSVESERILYVSDDPKQGFQIWGEIPGEGINSAVDLCQVFLEYAMTCATECDRIQVFRNMKRFGSCLGETLAEHIKSHYPEETAKDLGVCALESILESMNAHFTVERRGTRLRFVLECCPLRQAAERVGLFEVELAHYGINAFIRRLIHQLEPRTAVYAPANEGAVHTFRVTAKAAV